MLHSITIGSEILPVLIRKHSGARRMVIRYQPRQHAVSVTVPRYVSQRQGLRFVEEKRGWIEQQIKEKPPHVPFADGQILPVFGKEYRLCHRGGRGVTRLEEEEIIVHGDQAFMARRVREWLKSKAKEEIMLLARNRAERIGKKLGRVTLRDTSSCWGSCSHGGNLSFSWRLIFAPYAVLDYIVCHEVAHLTHHNHSAKFWAVVKSLCPQHEQANEWLKAHGAKLHVYG